MKKVYEVLSSMGELLRPVSDCLLRNFGILFLIYDSACRLTYTISIFIIKMNASNQVSTSGDAFKHLFRLRFYSNSNLLETTYLVKELKTQI